MVQRFTFPQSGDADDAEHFASMIGQSNLTNYVETGLSFTYDNTVPEVDVSEGKGYISLSTDVASSTGETILEVNHVVQVPTQTVSLTDSATNYLYLEPDFATDDNGTVNAYTSQQTGNILLIGVIDTSADTVETRNRDPSIDALDMTLGDGREMLFGDAPDFSIKYNSTSDELELTDEVNDTTKQTWDKSGDTHIPSGALNFRNSNNIQDSGTDAIQFNGSAEVTVPNKLTAGSPINLSNSSAIQDSGTNAINFDSLANVSIDNGDLDLSGGDLEDGATVIWDQSAGEIPDSAMGSVDNSTLTNSSVSVAGNSVSLGGSTTVDYIDLNDTGSSFPIPNSDLSNSSVSVAGNSVSLGGSTTVSVTDLSDVSSTTESAGQIPVWNGTNSQYENASISGGTEIAITEGDANVTVDLDTPINLGADTDTDLAGNDLSDGATVIWDQSAGEIPDSAMGSIGNSTLTNSSVSVAGNSVSLGGSTSISANDLSDVSSSTESAGQIPVWNGTNSQYENASISGGTEIAITEGDANVTVDLDTPINLGADTDTDLAGNDLEDGATVIWDQSAGEIPDSAMGSVGNSTLTNSSVSVAGNSVSLGGSTTVDYIDLNDTGSSFPIPNGDLSNSSVTVAGNSVSLGGSTSISANDLSDVSSGTESAGQIPIWNGTNSQYENASISGGTEIAITEGNASVTIDLDTPINLGADTDTDLAGNDLSDGATVIWDQSAGEIPDSAMGSIGNSTLTNSSVTVAGNSVSLGGSTSINHNDLSTISANDHHAKYTDSEAVSAVNAETSLSVDISGDADTVDGENASDLEGASQREIIRTLN